MMDSANEDKLQTKACAAQVSQQYMVKDSGHACMMTHGWHAVTGTRSCNRAAGVPDQEAV